MAFTRKMASNRHEELRGELGSFLGANPHPALRAGAMFIGSSFQVYSLALDGAAKATRGADLVDCLVNTGNWQHQIVQQKRSRVIAFSSSRNDTKDSLRVTGVIATPVAGKIDRAIGWIDRERSDNRTEVFFFIVPAFQLQCFLLRSFSQEEIFVVSNSARLKSLREGTAYDVREFLVALQQTQPVKGIAVTI